MKTFGLVLGVLAALGMLLGFILLLGGFNWHQYPFCILASLDSSLILEPFPRRIMHQFAIGKTNEGPHVLCGIRAWDSGLITIGFGRRIF